ncbi:MAG: SDR family NAD-dependent epimerase/dehydratase, partial [Bacteroidota bacterium]
ELAKQIIALTATTSKIVHEPLPDDDPTQRKPDISLAKEILNWEPDIHLEKGLTETINYFKNKLNNRKMIV